MIPIPAALVCPKTCDTVAEDACNIASHLSIDRTHDKWGTLRQSWSSHVREPPNFFQCEVRHAPFLVCNPFLDAICRAQQRALWERLHWNQTTSCTFTSTYWRTFMNHPGIWFPSQQHWFVPRHVTLWQKMLVTSPVTFPLTVLMTSEEYSGSLEAAMSENHPTSSSVKWVLLSLCVILSWMRSAGHSHVQVASVNENGSFQNQITSRTLTSRFVLVPDTWDRFKQTHSQQPGGENILEHCLRWIVLKKRPVIRTCSTILNAQSLAADLFNWCQAFFVLKMTRIR